MTQPQQVLLGRVIGLPDGTMKAIPMPGLEADEAIAMCGQCAQAFLHRQMQLLNATHAAKPKILVPQVGFRL